MMKSSPLSASKLNLWIILHVILRNMSLLDIDRFWLTSTDGCRAKECQLPKVGLCYQSVFMTQNSDIILNWLFKMKTFGSKTLGSTSALGIIKCK